MDLKQLLYFVTVVEEGNISAAARKLFMSQPPLSTQLRLLEEELDCVLFRRGQRQIQLTEAGKLLYAKAKVMLEISRATKEEVRECADAQSGTIRLGIVSSVIYPMATQWISDYARLHPEVNFSIFESDTYDLIEKLRSNIVHIAFVRTPYTADEMAARPLKTEHIVALGKSALFPDDNPVATPEALADRPIILYRRWESVIKQEFAKANVHLNVKYLCDNARTATDLVSQGLGIGLTPASAARVVTDPQVVCKRFKHTPMESRIDLIHKENVYLPACVSRFCDYLEKEQVISAPI